MLTFSTRATFELALRYCRRHLEHMKACARAEDLLETNSNRAIVSWGKATSTNMKSKVTRFTNEVDSVVNENEVCSWWQEHFDTLHISFSDGAKDSFISLVENMRYSRWYGIRMIGCM
jgi:hypothetical protein